MTIQIKPSGPRDAKIMIVGEAPSRNEVLAGEPFVGASGKELSNMLHEAGILRTECFLTNVCRVQPPGNNIKKLFIKDTPKTRIPGPEITAGIALLMQEIEEVQPNIIIALGDIAMWALTGERGITKWRGSILKLTGESGVDNLIPGTSQECKVLPTYHPAAILRKWDWRFIAVQDLRRACDEAESAELKEPQYDFIIRPDFSTVMRTLDKLLDIAENSQPNKTSDDVGHEQKNVWGNNSQKNPAHTDAQSVTINPTGDQNEQERTDKEPFRENPEDLLILAGDIETRGGHIACLGIGWSKTEAICIPFICVESQEGYWSEEEEIAIILKLKKLFTNPRIGWVFQNGIYDYQYFARWWGFLPRIWMDTMLAQHTCFAGLPKGLDFQSSLYCEYHRYWKDEGKEFHTSIKSPGEEDLYWVYNCKDCVTSYEIAFVHVNTITVLNAWEPYIFQMEQFRPVLRTMLRGVNVDREKKAHLLLELSDAIAERETWLTEVLGKYVNPKSPKQMQELFYSELSLPVQKNRKTGRPTTNDEALQTLAKKEPLVAPLVRVFSELRSLNVFLSTFVKAPVSDDGRMRSSYNIAGTETFRWSSSSDAFGKGMNLQNIPKGNE